MQLADKLEDQQAEVKRGALVGEEEGGEKSVVAKAEDTKDGVIVINEIGTIRMTNRLANNIFG